MYSMSGDGRGHATRVQTVVEQLKQDYEIVLLTPGDAHPLLESRYGADPRVSIKKIPGMNASYRKQQMAYIKSYLNNIPYLWNLNDLTKSVVEMIEEIQPVLAITDFEPVLPRAARKLDVPFISFNHQHFLTACDFSRFPRKLRWKAWFIGAFIPMFYTGQQATIISAFHLPPLKKGWEHAICTGVMLRDRILQTPSTEGDYLLVYVRKFASEDLLSALRRCDREVRLYGLGKLPDDGPIRYCEIDSERFVDDLAGCYALITTAGNQLLGEALYLRKPVLAIPEKGNFEQSLNGFLLEELGWGVCHKASSIHRRHLLNFVERVPDLRAKIEPQRVVGNVQAMEAIRRYLPESNSSNGNHPQPRATEADVVTTEE